jgi:hypothetical protein
MKPPALAIAIKPPSKEGGSAGVSELMKDIAEMLKRYSEYEGKGDWKKCAELCCYIHEVEHAIMDLGGPEGMREY